MERLELLAAEIFGYSYQHYQQKLDMGHQRFKVHMPDMVAELEKAEAEGWSDEELAKALDVREGDVAKWRENFRQTTKIVDASSPAESFQNGIRYSVLNALTKGLNEEKDIDDLVVQIGYRTLDFGFLLNQEGKVLSDYSEQLRKILAEEIDEEHF